MPSFCAVFGCSNRGNREFRKSFFRFPSVKNYQGIVCPSLVRRKELWLKAVNRKDLTDKKLKYARICSDHFSNGKPSNNQNDADYVPNLHLGYTNKTESCSSIARRSRRNRKELMEPESNIDSNVTVIEEFKEDTLPNELHIPIEEQKIDFETVLIKVEMDFETAKVQVKEEIEDIDDSSGTQSSQLLCDELILKVKEEKVDNIHEEITIKEELIILEEQDSNDNEKYSDFHEKDLNIDERHSDELISSPDEENTGYKCNVCPKRFIYHEALTMHKWTHSSEEPFVLKIFKCRVCAKIFKHEPYLLIHEELHKAEELFVCYICNKEFVRSELLLQHERTNHDGESYEETNQGTRPNVCIICDKRFSLHNNLKIHMLTHRKYKCDVCGETFDTSSEAMQHERQHKNDKPNKCNYCAQQFKHLSSLIAHKRLHTNGKPFNCDYCDMAFKNIHRKNEHELIHTKERPFKCDVCDKYFRQLTALRVHKMTHTGIKPFKCNVCDRFFAHKHNLNRHIRTHTGENPYTCNTCNVGFNQLNTLKQHMNRHTGIRPYKCESCNKRFKQSSALWNHKRKLVCGKD